MLYKKKKRKTKNREERAWKIGFEASHVEFAKLNSFTIFFRLNDL